MKLTPYISATAILLLLASCNDKKTTSETTDASSDITLLQPTDPVFAERDSLIALFNDISGDLVQIKQVESIVTIPGGINKENGTTVPKLRDDLVAIQNALQERRKRLAELEKKLKDSSGKNTQLLQMVNHLKEQMAQNEQIITSLKDQLAQANITIAGLNTKVDSLNASVANVSEAKAIAEQKNTELTNELNRCYYAIGSKDELKKHKLITTGFLRKTKIMQGDYESSYFTTADKRTLTSIPLYSKKAKVLTNQPEDTYTMTTDAKGNKILNIKNPAKFWNAANYLIVQTD